MIDFHKNKEYYQQQHWTVDKARQEIEQGLKLLDSINQPVILFAGSARVKEGNYFYDHCKQLSQTLGKEGYAIMSGGGPGIMHAANSGATEAKSVSIGLKASLLTKEKINDNIFTHTLDFHFFFARRFIMLLRSEALIFYPGGYGTLNELLENAMLMQNNIVDNVPLICVGKKYWQGLFDWLKQNTLEYDFISKGDLKLLYIVDTVEEAIEIIKKHSHAQV